MMLSSKMDIEKGIWPAQVAFRYFQKFRIFGNSLPSHTRKLASSAGRRSVTDSQVFKSHMACV